LCGDQWFSGVLGADNRRGTRNRPEIRPTSASRRQASIVTSKNAVIQVMGKLAPVQIAFILSVDRDGLFWSAKVPNEAERPR
jgi:hypothetical protein